MNNLINAISYLLEVGVPREWQTKGGWCVILPTMFDLLPVDQNHCFSTAVELAFFYIQRCIDRASRLRLLAQVQARLIGLLSQDDLDEIATRFGMTGLHQRLFLPGPQLTAEGLMDLMPFLNKPDRKGRTPLYYAIQWASYAVEMLLNSGADLQSVEQPLHLAIKYSDSTVVGLLTRGGADVNERKHDGSTPLIHLTEWEYYIKERYEKINELVRHTGDKIDWDARDDDGKTALDYALERRLPIKFVRLLKRHASLSKNGTRE